MGILIFLGIFAYFIIFLKKLDTKAKKNLVVALIVVLIYSLFLNFYLENIMGWKYGIPGADLKHYFDAAKSLHNGRSVDSLKYIWNVFDNKISHSGYMIYVYFIYFVSFFPVIISYGFSIKLVYFIQCIISVLSAYNVACFFEDDNKYKYNVFWAFLLNIGILEMSSVLMRDIWIVFFISLLLIESKKEKSSIIKSFLFIIGAFLIRNYTLLITIPIFVAYILKKRKAAIVISGVFFLIFFFGQSLIQQLAQWAIILWDYNFKFDVNNIFKFLFYPNPVNQVENTLKGLDMHYHAIHGGNTFWQYLLLSIWNLVIYPFSIYGIYMNIKKRENLDWVIWILIIMNIVLIYSVFYNGISEPRHKLMILYSMMYFYDYGIKNISIYLRWGYYIFVAIFICLIFVIV